MGCSEDYTAVVDSDSVVPHHAGSCTSVNGIPGRSDLLSHPGYKSFSWEARFAQVSATYVRCTQEAMWPNFGVSATPSLM